VRARLIEKPEEWLWSSYRGTAGIEKAHPSVTTDWVLGQFGTKRKEAERRYGVFVRAGIGTASIWEKVKGQSLLGEEGFAEELTGYLEGQKDISEIPRSRRYVGRPLLREIFTDDVAGRKKERDRKIIEAAERYGYSQREVADHLGLHYTTVSRIVNEEC
jgi:putative transposase